MTPRDFAEVLLRKAKVDLDVLRILADRSELPDDALGFHAQQSVEKALKAVLTAVGTRAGNLHAPARLITLLEEARIEIPDWLRETEGLADYGVMGRYVELDPEEQLDRRATVALVDRTLQWAAAMVQDITSA
jgi:HEPN domain-containing protein